MRGHGGCGAGLVAVVALLIAAKAETLAPGPPRSPPPRAALRIAAKSAASAGDARLQRLGVQEWNVQQWNAGTQGQKETGALAGARWDVRQVLRRTLLPTGYPESVPAEYLRFRTWMVLQDLSTFFRGILTLQKVLEGFGVGRTDVASSLQALRWLARDGVGHFGLLLFTSLCSKDFGSNVKRWRLFADLTCDVAIILEMVASLSQRWFLPLVCLASLGKAICGVAAGAANGATDLHFARNGDAGGRKTDISEIMAKNGAQETAVKLLGLSLSYWFSVLANRSARSIWLTFSALTVFHVFANYQALRCLRLRSLNQSRLAVLLPLFLAAQDDAIFKPGATPELKPRQTALELQAVAEREAILGIPGRRPIPRERAPPIKVRLGASPSACLALEASQAEHAAAITPSVLERLKATGRRVGIVPTGKKRRTVHVMLSDGASEAEKLQGMLQAYVFGRLQQQAGTTETSFELLEQAHTLAEQLAPALRENLAEHGWQLEPILVEDAGWRWS